MNSSDLRRQLSLVDAQLFASTDLAVITAIDNSNDAVDASTKLQSLGMSEAEAIHVLEMPLRARTRIERESLFTEANRLRDLLG